MAVLIAAFIVAASIVGAALFLGGIMSEGSDAVLAAINEQTDAITTELAEIATAIENAAGGSANEAFLLETAAKIRAQTERIKAAVTLPEPPQ